MFSSKLIFFIYYCSKGELLNYFLEQVQNFPQDNNNFKIFPSYKFSPVSYQVCAGFEIPWLRVRISAGRALKERQCTLKGQARYVNVRAVYTGRDSSAWLDRRRWDQVHKFPHMGKFMHLILFSFSLALNLLTAQTMIGLVFVLAVQYLHMNEKNVRIVFKSEMQLLDFTISRQRCMLSNVLSDHLTVFSLQI